MRNRLSYLCFSSVLTFLVLILPGSLPQVIGQTEGLDTLVYFADVMRNTQKTNHREYAARKFKDAFLERLQAPDGFEDEFTELDQWVSFQYPGDTSFRVVTWQVDGQDNYRYEGVIQFKDGRTITLNDVSSELSDFEYDILSADSWYGAIYYDMVMVDESTYILLGFNAVNDRTSSKIAEVLHFNNNGDVSLGHEIFYMDDDSIRPDVKTRILLNYSELAAVRLTYDDSSQLLFFDNLIPVESYENDGETVWVQDGSYSGFELLDGRLRYIEKLFDTKVDEPPRERPVDENKKDILGRPSKG